MLQAARRSYIDQEVERPNPVLELATADAVAVASPAHALQSLVESCFLAAEPVPEPHVKKLHPAARLGVLAALTAGSWLSVLMIGRGVLGLALS